jgi:hypothetical protein
MTEVRTPASNGWIRCENFACKPVWLFRCVPFRACLCVPSPRSHLFGARFRAARRHSFKSGDISKAFSRSVDSAVRTMASPGPDRFSAAATDVFRFRTFHSRYFATFYFTFLALCKPRCYQFLLSELGLRSCLGHGGPERLCDIFCYPEPLTCARDPKSRKA